MRCVTSKKPGEMTLFISAYGPENHKIIGYERITYTPLREMAVQSVSLLWLVEQQRNNSPNLQMYKTLFDRPQKWSSQ